MAVSLSELGRALKRAQYRNHVMLERELQEIGCTVVQWDALRTISETPGSSAHDLAGATFQSDQAFGTLANRLVQKGLVDRIPGSGRRIEHRLTADGQSMLAAGTAIAQRVVTRSFDGFDASERETLLGLLSRVGHG